MYYTKVLNIHRTEEKGLILPHFFISSNTVAYGIITISGKNDYTHIAKSLRAKVGENLLLIDENQIQYEVKIEKITSSQIETKVTASYKSKRGLGFELYLAQSPLRSDSQTLVVEKATELGVKGLYPVLTDNCALNKEAINKKIPKWQKTMLEASKQCERATVPTCFELTTIPKITANTASEGAFDRILAFTERKADYTLKHYMRENPIKANEKILVIIGPEGGFSAKEFEYFETNNITTLSLGKLILKAETAVITAIGNIVYEYE